MYFDGPNTSNIGKRVLYNNHGNINGNNKTHRVKTGENLTKIAKFYGTSVAELMNINKNITKAGMIYAGEEIIVPNNEKFIAREDFNPKNMNLGVVMVDNQEVSTVKDKPLTSNTYANDLATIASMAQNDTNPNTKFTINIQPGREMNARDGNAFGLLNKTVFPYFDTNIQIVDNNGKKDIKETKLEETDLYSAIISEEVNGDNFAPDGKLVPRGESGNTVQLPAVEVDANGVKYFSLIGADNKPLYFDIKGKSAELENGILKNPQVEIFETKEPTLPENIQSVAKPTVEKFEPDEKNYRENSLNLGKIFIDGKEIEKPVKSAFYANGNYQSIMEATLNDTSGASRVDMLINVGSQATRDLSGKDAIKKYLGNMGKNIKQDSDLYNAMFSETVNGETFKDGKFARSSEIQNFVVQFPALETDANGIKYYTLHTSDNKILYFNEKGSSITPAE